MATGTINLHRKSYALGFYATVTADSTTAYDQICHGIAENVRPYINDFELTMFYANVNSAVAYYGIITKVSSKVIIGTMYYVDINVGRIIKFRDSSDDSVATYKVYSYQ